MTRPRSLQINSPSIKLTSIVLPSLPAINSGSTNVATSGITSQTATGQFAGHIALPAILTSTVNSLITTTVGDFNISLDGGAAITVTVVSGDLFSTNQTTPSLIAYRINQTSLLTGVASVSDSGCLVLKSLTTGASSSVAVTAGTISLATLGFNPASTATGSDAVDGVVTESADQKGGYAFLSTSEGNPVIANSPTLFRLKTTGNEYVSGIVPNAPVLARTTLSGSDLVLSYAQRVYGNGPLVSYRSKFPDIVGGDSLTIDIKDNVSAYTSTQISLTGSTFANATAVINAINIAWGTRRTGVAVAQKSEPYYVQGILVYSIDGGASATVAFTGSERTAAEVATAIGAAAGTEGAYLRIFSTSTTGPTSKVTIDSSSDAAVLEALGLSVGVYSGSLLASVVGTEVKLTPPCPSATITIGGSGGAADKYGFYSGDTASTLREIPVTWPQLPANASSIVAKVTEFMEFGQIPETADESNELAALQSLTPFMAPDELEGARKSGQLVSRTSTGDLESGGSADFLSGRVGSVTFPTQDLDAGSANPRPAMAVSVIDDDVTPILEGIKADGNVRILSNDLTDISAITLTSNAEYDRNANNWKADNTSAPASRLDLQKESLQLKRKATTTPAWADNAWTDVISAGVSTGITGIGQELTIHGATSVLRGNGSSLKITDDNIDGATTQAFINVSDSSGGQFLRIGGKEANNTTSLIKSINGRAYISIGDGSDTFGDFNGVGAFDAAVNFINTNSITNASIFVKAGDYESTSQITITDKNITVIGESRDNCRIRRTNAGSFLSLISSTLDINTFVAKNVSIEVASATSSAIVSNSVKVDLENCEVEGLLLELASPQGDLLGFKAVNCTIHSSGVAYSALSIKAGATQLFDGYQNYPGLFVQNTKFVCSSAVNNRCILIEGPVPGTPSPTAYQYENFTFDNCEFDLASATLSVGTGDLVPTRGTGLFELDPRDASSLVVKQLSFTGCRVSALGTTASRYNVLMAASPFLTSASSIPAYAGIVKSLVISDTRFDCYIGTNSDSLAPSCFIVGAGVESLSLTDCQINLTSTASGLYGTPPYWYSSSITDDYDRFPNIIFDCFNSSIRNLEINGCIRRSSKAGTEYGTDLGLVQGNRLSVDGLSLSYSSSNTGGGDAPKCRVVYRTPVSNTEPSYSTDTQGCIKGLRLTGFSVADTQSWLGADDRGFIEARTKNTIFDSCLVTGFAYSITPTYKNWSSILCTGLASGEVLDNVSIQNSRFESGSRGINLSFDPSELVGDFTISGNFIKVAGNSNLSEYGQGIAYWTNDAAPLDCSRIIRGNQIEVSGMPFQTTSGPISIATAGGLATSAGIWVGANEDQTFAPILMSIVGNSITCINTSPFNTNHVPAIFVSTNLNAGASINPGAIVDSNICKEYNYNGSSPYTVGWVHAMAQDGTDFIAVPTTTGTPFSKRLIGLETAISGATATYTAADPLIRNYAKLCLGNVPGKES